MQDGEIRGGDCINGTMMPRAHLPDTEANYTVIHRVFQDHGFKYPLDAYYSRERSMERIPYDTEITIYNRTKVLATSGSTCACDGNRITDI